MYLNSKTRIACQLLKMTEEMRRGRDLIKELAISAPYLEQIVAPLVKKGFIKTVRGCQGGYVRTDKKCDLWELVVTYTNKKPEYDGELLSFMTDVKKLANQVLV